jgi:TonB-dependent Receptor Plug Domain
MCITRISVRTSKPQLARALRQESAVLQPLFRDFLLMRAHRAGSIASVLLRIALFTAPVLGPLRGNAADVPIDRAGMPLGRKARGLVPTLLVLLAGALPVPTVAEELIVREIDGSQEQPAESSASSQDADARAAPQTKNPAAAQRSDQPQEMQAPVQNSRKERSTEGVIVTGTYIPKIDPITPVTTISSLDIQNQAYSTLLEVIEQLPQNFKAGSSQESNPVNAIGNLASNNYSFASGVNLRGLGSNATLVLLNGQRLAPTALARSPTTPAREQDVPGSQGEFSATRKKSNS